MIVSERHKFVAYLPMKTGSTTLERVLINRFNGRIIQHRHAFITPKKYRRYFKFLVVRNPYERELSFYTWGKSDRGDGSIGHKIKKCKSFQAYIENVVAKNKAWLSNADYLKRIIKQVKNDNITIIRTETLERDFNSLPFVRKHIKLPHLYASNNKQIARYNPTSANLLYEARKEDFEQFNYNRFHPIHNQGKLFL